MPAEGRRSVGLSWGSLAILFAAVALNFSFMTGGSFWSWFVREVKGYIQAMSIPVQAWPPFIIIMLVWSLLMYGLGWYIAFLEIGDDAFVDESEPKFLGKTYRGNPITDPVKMVIIVREDLGMRPGKVATQAAHSCVGLFNKLHVKRQGIAQAWMETGSQKMIGKVTSEEVMMKYQKLAKDRCMPTYIVRDAASKVVGMEVHNGNRSVLSFSQFHQP